MLSKGGFELNEIWRLQQEAISESLYLESDEQIERLRRIWNTSPDDKKAYIRYEQAMRAADRLPELISQHLDTHYSHHHVHVPYNHLWNVKRRSHWARTNSLMEKARERARRLAHELGGHISDYIERREGEPFREFESRVLHLHAPSSPIYQPRGEGNSTIHFADTGFTHRDASYISRNAFVPGGGVQRPARFHNVPSDPDEKVVPKTSAEQAEAFANMWRRAGGRARRARANDPAPAWVDIYSVVNLQYPRRYWKERRADK